MANFGYRKIGKAAFEVEKIKNVVKSKFGPRKFGARKAAAMAADLAVAESVVEAERVVEPARVVDDETMASIKQIDTALQENPALYEELYKLELERPDGARKGALRIFMREEMALEGGPRDERQAELENLLKPKR